MYAHVLTWDRVVSILQSRISRARTKVLDSWRPSLRPLRDPYPNVDNALFTQWLTPDDFQVHGTVASLVETASSLVSPAPSVALSADLRDLDDVWTSLESLQETPDPGNLQLQRLEWYSTLVQQLTRAAVWWGEEALIRQRRARLLHRSIRLGLLAHYPPPLQAFLTTQVTTWESEAVVCRKHYRLRASWVVYLQGVINVLSDPAVYD